MAVIHLHTDKSVISIPMEVPADAQFVLYHGTHFAIAATSANRRIWEEHKGDVPAGAKVAEYAPTAPTEAAADAPPAPNDVPRAPGDAVPKPKNVAQATAEALGPGTKATTMDGDKQAVTEKPPTAVEKSATENKRRAAKNKL